MTGWKVLCAGLVFTAVSTVSAAGMATLAGRVDTSGAWVAVLLGTIAAGLTARGAMAPKQHLTLADTTLFIIFALVSLRAFLWIIYPQGNELRVLSPHNLGDMSLHLNLIQRWAHGGTFWPSNPFLAGAIFPYHPGMDLWNALLQVLGLPLYQGLRWTGLLGAAATAAALWRWGRGFTVAAFLFAGGFGALTLIQISGPDIMEAKTAWKNPFLTMLVTQRGLLYSLPAGLVLMTAWRAELGEPRSERQLPILAQAALYASMPLFNAPAFIFLSAVLLACAVSDWRHKMSGTFFATGMISAIPATWLVLMVTAGLTAPSALRFLPGWMQGDDGLGFWLWNFGAFLPLVVVVGVMVFRRGSGQPANRVFFSVGLATLLFSFLFALAPWPWDNTKLILWGYLTIMPLLWSELIHLWPQWARSVACLVLFASGGLSLAAGLDQRHGYKLADRAELAAVQASLRSMPINQRLAVAPSYEHPALLLGQPVVMGHDGHLFSQGLDYKNVHRRLDDLMSGRKNWREAARRLQVHYLFWGQRESEKWPDSPQPWKTSAPAVAKTSYGTLYLLTPCLLR